MTKINNVNLEDELQSSYIDYAMSVIIGRAIPDARDGLKPAQRRILYAMSRINNTHNQPTKKSARVVGETIGKYHPHGDIAVYDTMVRMAQDFSLNHMLVEGQGNMGCFTKDTKIMLTDGRTIDFEHLIKEHKDGKKNWTYSFNTKTNQIEIAEVKNPRLTRKNAELIEVRLDNGDCIKCTPDHKFMLRNGQYKKAKELSNGESLMPLYIKINDGAEDKNLKGYEMILQPKQNNWQFTHRLADEFNLKEGVYAKSRGKIRHHIDIGKRSNNGIPKASNALQYFTNFDQIIKEAKLYNHKVLEVKILSERADVYDITVDPWHNFALASGIFVHNSVDGDPAAAMRYTEVRLTRLAEEILEDLDKNTVQMVPNFDNTEKEPSVLPGKVPNLLINGSYGIAVGVATSMPSHNLNEVCDAIIFKLKNKDATIENILNIIKGPDFPTGGTVIMSSNSYNGYKTGRGQLTIRGKIDIDSKKNKLIINELPYSVNKASLIHTIANLVRDKKITGIRDIRDETGRTGMSVVIELKNGEDPNQIINQLYNHTQLQTTFPIINLAVVGTSLKSLNVLQLIDVYITHRLEIILKRSSYELGIATDRLHIVEGLVIALGNIDEIIKTIKKSEELSDARRNLIQQFQLSEKQSNAILDMKLSRLTHLEGASLLKEKTDLQTKIANFKSIIESKEKQEAIIILDMEDLKKKYGRARRTEIIQSDEPLNIKDEDMISNEKVSIILTKEGYVKRLPLDTYHEQARGGKGIISINLKEGDFVNKMLTCNNKDYILFITDLGRAYWLKAYSVPESGRYAEGKAIVNLLNLTNEKVVTMLNTKEFANSKIVFLTAKGLVKKTDAMLFSRPRSSGIRAITLNDGDKIAASIIFKDEKYLLIATKNGKSIKFDQSTLRLTGRGSMGVRGIKLKNDEAMNIIAANDLGSVLTITEKGYGKITDIALYRSQSRSGSGVINLKVNNKTGNVLKALFVKGNEQLMLISSTGITITIPVSSIRVTGRAASGVRLMRLDDSASVSDAKLLEGQTDNKSLENVDSTQTSPTEAIQDIPSPPEENDEDNNDEEDEDSLEEDPEESDEEIKENEEENPDEENTNE